MAARTFLVCTLLLILKSTHGDDSYTAAVVDFAPMESPPLTNFKANLDAFISYIGNAKDQGADIIIFPEIGLTGYGPCLDEMYTTVPHPANKVAPYEDTNSQYTTHLADLSRAAKENSIYVLVNLVEKEVCDGDGGKQCPEQGRRLYNTNVVFDRNGTVIARYRKFNLFGEPDKSITTDPQLSFFDTDFGVRFGVFTCFDLMFDRPALQLVKQLGIRDIVFPTAWFSELPFLTAVQAQQMWAYVNDVNFLGSGYNKPTVGSGGSGIYLGKLGAIQKVFQNTSDSQMLIESVPKKSYKTNLPNKSESQRDNSKSTTPLVIETREIYLKRENMSSYSSRLVQDLTADNSVCHGEFCCKFNVSVIPNNLMPDEKYFYRAVVFNGVRSFDGVATGGIQTCGIVSCGNETFESCGTRIDFPPIFKNILISGTFEEESSLPMPSTVRSDLLPLMPEEFSYVTSCNGVVCNITMSVAEETEDLLTFGIYSRVFSRDGEPATEPSSASSTTSWMAMVLMGLLGIHFINRS